MEIIVAKSAGFCFGVKRAVDTVYSEIKKGGKIYTFGPIIHNDRVVSDLAEKGVSVINDISSLEGAKEGCVIIRSHGVSRKVFEDLERTGLKIVDATCPFVKKIHRIVESESMSGKKVVVIGDPVHPEVVGIVGW